MFAASTLLSAARNDNRSKVTFTASIEVAQQLCEQLHFHRGENFTREECELHSRNANFTARIPRSFIHLAQRTARKIGEMHKSRRRFLTLCIIGYSKIVEFVIISTIFIHNFSIFLIETAISRLTLDFFYYVKCPNFFRIPLTNRKIGAIIFLPKAESGLFCTAFRPFGNT